MTRLETKLRITYALTKRPDEMEQSKSHIPSANIAVSLPLSHSQKCLIRGSYMTREEITMRKMAIDHQ